MTVLVLEAVHKGGKHDQGLAATSNDMRRWITAGFSPYIYTFHHSNALFLEIYNIRPLPLPKLLTADTCTSLTITHSFRMCNPRRRLPPSIQFIRSSALFLGGSLASEPCVYHTARLGYQANNTTPLTSIFTSLHPLYPTPRIPCFFSFPSPS